MLFQSKSYSSLRSWSFRPERATNFEALSQHFYNNSEQIKENYFMTEDERNEKIKDLERLYKECSKKKSKPNPKFQKYLERYYSIFEE